MLAILPYKKILAGICILFSLHANCQDKSVPVFISGEEGYKSYRIPAIIALPDGKLLAFAEGRLNGSDDFGDIQIVMKSSKDKGRSWSPLTVIASYNHLQTDNPAPVVDRTDPAYPQGRIFLFYNTGTVREPDMRKGKGIREVWYKTSTDGGINWSDPINITQQVHHPNQPAVNPAYQSKEDWRAYANTPGHAMQISGGQYAGRILVVANHSAGNPQPHYLDGDVHGYYSDDHGKSFQLTANLKMPGSNEVSAAELSDHRVMINARNQKGDPRARIVAVSSTGAAKWDTAYYDMSLPDPVCQGSILNILLKGKKPALVFSNDQETKKRDGLTLRLSVDDGKSWKKSWVIAKSPADYKGDYSAYSDLVQTGKNKVGVLYESDNYKKIIFTTVKLK